MSLLQAMVFLITSSHLFFMYIAGGVLMDRNIKAPPFFYNKR